MKILTAISYFKGDARSEIWQIDTISHKKRKLIVLPKNRYSVKSKGVTGITWIDEETLVGCDFNRVIKINRNTGNVIDEKVDYQFNDLHQICTYKNQLIISNTGRDSIDFLSFDFKELNRYSKLSVQEWHDRKVGNYEVNDSYYDNPKDDIPFFQRKTIDKYHFNSAIKINKFKDKIIVNCFYEKCLRDLKTFEVISNNLPDNIHDGVIFNNNLWITTVSGKIYKAELSLPFKFKLAIDLFATALNHGWCRGLFFESDYAYIGVTVLYKNNERTPWLKQDIRHTRTGIYKYNMNTHCIDQFYDLSHHDGARIFSIVIDKNTKQEGSK